MTITSIINEMGKSLLSVPDLDRAWRSCEALSPACSLLFSSNIQTGGKMIRRIACFLLVFVSFNAFSAPSGYVKEEFVRVWHPGFSPGQFSEALPLRFTYPAGFKVKQQNVKGKQFAFIYSPTSDVDCFINGGGEKCLGGGLFAIELSSNVAYDTRKKLFTGESAEEKAQYEKVLKENGIKNIVFRRADANGVPVFEHIAERGRKTYLAYIAIGNTGEAFRITFFQPQVQSARDDEIWRAFVDGLGTKK